MLYMNLYKDVSDSREILSAGKQDQADEKVEIECVHLFFDVQSVLKVTLRISKPSPQQKIEKINLLSIFLCHGNIQLRIMQYAWVSEQNA